MKFDSLYKQVFLLEQDEEALTPSTEEGEENVPQEDGIPVPDNYNVEPAPVTAPSTGGAIKLNNYITQLNEFAKAMQNTEGECLQKLVNDIDRNGSLFMGISREMSSSIIKIASDAKDLATILEGFILNSAKRQRDIAAGQQ
jgi:hypothetical protein